MKEIMVASGSPPRWRRFQRRIRAQVLGALLLIPAAAHAQRAELERRIQHTTLPNGLEIIVVANPGVPLVTIEADVKNGSFTQGPEYEGLSHLYEHMFFRANAEYPNSDQFIARASELGAVFNGSTTEERVNYYVTLPADSIEGGMRFLAAALTHPLFREDELARERQVVLGEYDRNEASPYFDFITAMGKALWTSSWSRKNPLGERSVIASTTPEKMRVIQQRYYVPNNTAIVVTGDVTPARAFDLARTVFGQWPRGRDPFADAPIPPVPPLRQDTAVIAEQQIPTVVLMLQWQGPSATRDVASTYAADVFSDVLNQPGSNFQRRLVDSGLFQSIGVNYYTQNHVGPITISAETSPGKLLDALAALNAEIGKFGDSTYFTLDELNAIKQQRIVGTMLGLERASGFAHQIGFWWAVTGLDYFLGYVDTMAHQTRADLQHYAETYIVAKPHVVGVLLAPSVKQALQLDASRLLRPAGTP